MCEYVLLVVVHMLGIIHLGLSTHCVHFSTLPSVWEAELYKLDQEDSQAFFFFVGPNNAELSQELEEHIVKSEVRVLIPLTLSQHSCLELSVTLQ